MAGPLDAQKIEELRERREVIELVKARASVALGDDAVHNIGLYQLREYRAEQLAATIVEVERDVQAQRLEDDVVPVQFTRTVPYRQEQVRVYAILAPRNPREAWKLRHRWLSRLLWMGPVRYSTLRAQPAGKRHRLAHAEVTIDETVTIERRLTYPHSTYRLPENTFGPAVYREIRRTSW